LKRHKESRHEATRSTYLKKHKLSKHEGL